MHATTSKSSHSFARAADSKSAMGQCTVLLFVVITSQKEKEKWY